MGSGTSIVIPEGDNGGRKDALEWLFLIRNALKNDPLRLRMKEFLEAGSTLSSDEKNSIRLFVDLEVWSKLIRRFKILGEIEDLVKRKGKAESFRAEMSTVVMKIINQYVVTDAPYPLQLPREVRAQFGKLSLSMSPTSPSKPGGDGGVGGGESLAGGGATPSSDMPISLVQLDEMDSLINETELNLLPICRDMLNRFMGDSANSPLLREAMVQPVPKETITPFSSLATPSAPMSIERDGALSVGASLSSSAPASSPASAPASALASAAPVAPSTPGGSDTCILIVDDSYPMLKMLSFSLSKEGLEVVAVQKGETALELLKQRTFHAVLIDLEMPTMNGYDLAYMYRKYELGTSSLMSPPKGSTGGEDDFIPYVESITFADQQTSPSGHKRLLLIGMSSNKSDNVENKVRESGMDHFVEKPFTASTIISLIQTDRLG